MMTQDTSRDEVRFLCETANEFRHLLSDDYRKTYVMGVLDQMYASGVIRIDRYNEMIDELKTYNYGGIDGDC